VATVVCIEIPEIPNKLSITMPGVGELQYLKDSIDKIPRPSTYVLKMLNGISPALAPIYTILKILDVILALVNCINAIPKSLPFNPQPIIDCIQKLIEAFAALLPLLPPFVYIRLVVDIAVAIRLLIDDLISVLDVIDQQITQVKNLINKALDFDNTAMLQIGNCARTDIQRSTAGLQQIMEAMAKVMGIIMGIMELMTAVLPGPAADKIQKTIDDINTFNAAVTALDPAADYPPLQQMYDALAAARKPMVFVEEFGKALLGIPFTFTAPVVPSYDNP